MFFRSSADRAFSYPGSFSYGLQDKRLWMDIKIDSSPWTELHSSPRSPRHVLLYQSSVAHHLQQFSSVLSSYPRIDLAQESVPLIDRIRIFPTYRHTLPPA